MATFKVTLRAGQAGHWPVVVEWVAQGTFLPVRRFGVLELDLGALKEAQETAYGALLGKALFHGDVLVTLTEALTQARADNDGPLHVLLAVEAEDLEVLRWERLCAPLGRKDWTPMALDQRVPLSFHLPSRVDRRFPPIGRRDLRALILATNPADPENHWKLPPFDVGVAIEVARKSLGDIPCDVLADAEGSKGPPTLDALCDRLTAEQYTILHVVCHGAYVPEKKEPLLFLSDPEGRVAPVTATDLLDRLENLGETRGVPYFAFLSCCDLANPAAAEGAGGLAQRLVRDLGMPAVLAMTAPILVDAALWLASVFYRQLGLHGEVDLALAESCAGLAKHVNIAVPVVALFSRLEGRPIFSDKNPSVTPKKEVFFRVSNLIETNNLNEADRELARSLGILQDSAEFWYWKSRVAFARQNIDVASKYIEEALKRDVRHTHSVALKTKLLLLSTKRGDRAKAMELAQQSDGISDALDAWLKCLTAENMFAPGIRSNTELDAKCPFPVHVWFDA